MSPRRSALGANRMEGNGDRLDLSGLLVGQAAVGLDDASGRDGDPRCEPTVRWRERITAERREEDDLTAIGLTLMTRGAVPTRRRGCDHDRGRLRQATVTSEPTAEIVPDHSWPQIAGLYGRPDWYAWMSVPHIPQNAMSTTTPAGAGVGSGNSTSSTVS